VKQKNLSLCFTFLFSVFLFIAFLIIPVDQAYAQPAPEQVVYATDGGPANFYTINEVGGATFIDTFDIDC
jgi:hypothetical protein